MHLVYVLRKDKNNLVISVNALNTRHVVDENSLTLSSHGGRHVGLFNTGTQVLAARGAVLASFAGKSIC